MRRGGGREEAVYGGADHRLSEGGRCGDGGEGSVPSAWVFGRELLPVARQVRGHDGLGCKTAEGAGVRERTAEEAVGRVDAGAGGNAGGVAKKVVGAPARRELVRLMCAKGLSERRGLLLLFHK